MIVITIREINSNINIRSNASTLDTLLVLKRLVEHTEGKAFNYKQVMLDCADSVIDDGDE